VIKICAYRYSEMNHKDECNKHEKTLEEEIDKQVYDIHLLEKLTICPKDGYKVHAFVRGNVDPFDLYLFIMIISSYYYTWQVSCAGSRPGWLPTHTKS
jgi:hypothetical protein